jgi:hypothetical protein
MSRQFTIHEMARSRIFNNGIQVFDGKRENGPETVCILTSKYLFDAEVFFEAL